MSTNMRTNMNSKTKKTNKRKKRKQNRRKVLLIGIMIILVMGIITMFSKNKNKPEDTLQQYISKLQEKDYEAMYEMVSQNTKANNTKDEFVTRNQNIYEGISASNITVEVKEVRKEKEQTTINYYITMDTAGRKTRI